MPVFCLSHIASWACREHGAHRAAGDRLPARPNHQTRRNRNVIMALIIEARSGVGVTVLLSFSRLYTHDLDGLLSSLTVLGMPKPHFRFAMPEVGLELCGVGSCLIVAVTDEALAPFRDTAVTLIVEDLDASMTAMVDRGADVVRAVKTVPTGRNATIRIDGVQIELVQWSGQQWEQYRKPGDY